MSLCFTNKTAFSPGALTNLGPTALKSPLQSPKANAMCALVLATSRRECLDCLTRLSKPLLDFPFLQRGV
jgi:hypothetical protein